MHQYSSDRSEESKCTSQAKVSSNIAQRPVSDLHDVQNQIKNFEFEGYVKVCKQAQRAIENGSKDDPYLISKVWLDKWLNYVRNDCSRPPAINNFKLWEKLNNGGTVSKAKDFYILHPQIWEYLHDLYDGGPCMVKTGDRVTNKTVKLVPNIKPVRQPRIPKDPESSNSGDIMTKAVTSDIMRSKYKSSKLNSGQNGYSSSIHTNEFTIKHISHDSPVARLKSHNQKSILKKPNFQIADQILENSNEDD